jgi:hypothetical protein
VLYQGVCCVDYGRRCDIRVCAVSIMDRGVTSGCVLVDYGPRCDIRVCGVSIMDRGVTSGCVLCC